MRYLTSTHLPLYPLVYLTWEVEVPHINTTQLNIVQVTYATIMKYESKIVLHLHNYGDTDTTVSVVKILGTVDGINGEIKLKAGAHYVSVVDVSSLNLKEASVWTAVVNSGAGTAGFGGKFMKEFFPLLC